MWCGCICTVCMLYDLRIGESIHWSNSGWRLKFFNRLKIIVSVRYSARLVMLLTWYEPQPYEHRRLTWKNNRLRARTTTKIIPSTPGFSLTIIYMPFFSGHRLCLAFHHAFLFIFVAFSLLFSRLSTNPVCPFCLLVSVSVVTEISWLLSFILFGGCGSLFLTLFPW